MDHRLHLSAGDADAPATPRIRRPGAWRAPVASLAAVGASIAAVAVISPEEPGHYPTCPFLSLTGWACPGCGGLRAVHALTHGDVTTALERNVLVVAAIPLLALIWVQWLRRRLAERPLAGRSASAVLLWTLLGVVLTFWVVRNLPFGSWLAP